MQFINEQDAATRERFIERLEFRGTDPTFVAYREAYLELHRPAAHARPSWTSAAARASWRARSPRATDSPAP